MGRIPFLFLEEKYKIIPKKIFLKHKFDFIGDPNEHELCEKLINFSDRRGINFKVYWINGIAWCNGVDLFGSRMGTIIKKIDKKYIKSIEFFINRNGIDGAFIFNEFCVCRFFIKNRNFFFRTIETDLSLIKEMEGVNMATRTVKQQFVHFADKDFLSFIHKNRIKKIEFIGGVGF